MTKIDNFKEYVRKNPHLINFIRTGEMTWQKFYEIYDIYGEDNEVWQKYQTKKEEKQPKKESKTSSTFSNIMEMAKNIDTKKLQDGITSVQKAIGLFGDMIVKDKSTNTSSYSPRPIYRKFDD